MGHSVDFIDQSVSVIGLIGYNWDPCDGDYDSKAHVKGEVAQGLAHVGVLVPRKTSRPLIRLTTRLRNLHSTSAIRSSQFVHRICYIVRFEQNLGR